MKSTSKLRKLITRSAAAVLVTAGVWLALTVTPAVTGRASAQPPPPAGQVLVNDTGDYAGGLHVWVPECDPCGFALVANAPHCAAPRVVSFSGAFPSTREVLWPDACVAPGESVTVRISNDVVGAPPLTARVWVWSRDGTPLLSSPAPHAPPPRTYVNDTGQAADSLTLPLPGGFVFLVANPPACTAPHITTGVVAVLRWDDACIADGAGVTVLLAAAAGRDDPRVWTRMGLALRPEPESAPAVVEPLPPWRDAGTMREERRQHTATLLPDGRVLVVGGFNTRGGYPTAPDLFDPTTDTWTPAPPTQARYGSVVSAMVLNSGRVLLVDGSGIDTAELYDPSTDRWTRTGELPRPLGSSFFTIRLPDGRVLAVGLNASALYDPIADRWTLTGPGAPRPVGAGNRAVVLQDGRVLALTPGSSIQSPPADRPLRQPFRSIIYDPITDTWTPASPGQLLDLAASAVVLQDGRVMAVGNVILRGGALPVIAELYDPAADAWTMTMLEGMEGPVSSRITVLPDGRVLLIGGTRDRTRIVSRIFDPQSMRWSELESPRAVREASAIVRLADGGVLVIGAGYGSELPAAEVFDPASLTWQLPSRLTRVRSVATATRLPDGSVLVTDGKSAERYDPPADGDGLRIQ